MPEAIYGSKLYKTLFLDKLISFLYSLSIYVPVYNVENIIFYTIG